MSLAIYIGGVCAVIAVMLSSYFLGERSNNPRRNTPYESGIIATGSTKVKFFTQYFLVAILFIVFDIETIFIYLWASSAKSLGVFGFIAMSIFILTLLISLAYVLRLGILDGPRKHSRSKEPKT